MSLFQPPQARVPNTAGMLRQQVMFIETSPRRMAETLLKQWEQAFDTLWIEKDGITPTMRLEQLGDAAAELFEANAAMITFVVGMLQGKDDATVAKLMAKVATIPAHTVHEDGTVTLD